MPRTGLLNLPQHFGSQTLARFEDAGSGSRDGAKLVGRPDLPQAAVCSGKAGHVSAGDAIADTASGVAADPVGLDTGEAVAAGRVGGGGCSKRNEGYVQEGPLG